MHKKRQINVEIDADLAQALDVLEEKMPFRIGELVRRAIWRYIHEIQTNNMIEGMNIDELYQINENRFRRELEVIKTKEILSGAFAHRRFFNMLCKMVSAKCTTSSIIKFVSSSLSIADTYEDPKAIKDKICEIIKVENAEDTITQIRNIQFNFKAKQKDIEAENAYIKTRLIY